MRIRIVSYNIHKGVDAWRRYDIDRIARLLAVYEPDVVALQEVLRFRQDIARAPQLEVIGSELGFPHRVAGWNVPKRNGVYGNATLSRLPLELAENIDLKWRFKKRRSALYTCVATPGGPLHVFNVHLGLAHIERRAQMLGLLREIEERAGHESPVVILGDTNDWGDRLFPAVLARHGFVRCESTVNGRRRGSFPSWLPLTQLDKAFVRGAVRMVETFPVRRRAARVASDHLPVVVDVELQGG